MILVSRRMCDVLEEIIAKPASLTFFDVYCRIFVNHGDEKPPFALAGKGLEVSMYDAPSFLLSFLTDPQEQQYQDIWDTRCSSSAIRFAGGFASLSGNVVFRSVPKAKEPNIFHGIRVR